MAEALGVAASGIAVAQIATQVGASIIKLKRLWNELKDVPSSILDLLDQIDCLNSTLWEVANQPGLHPVTWDNEITNRSAEYCRKALDALTEHVDELTIHLNKPRKLQQRIAQVKVLLKKDQLLLVERRLQNAVNMLTLTQQSYLITMTRMQHQIIVQHLTAPRSPMVLLPQSPEPCIGSSNTAIEVNNHTKSMTTQRRRTKRGSDREASFKRSFWFFQNALELHLRRSYGSWQVSLNSYRIRPRGSEVFRVAQWGTVEELTIIFSSGLASPYDRDSVSHSTLLHFAFDCLNTPVLEYLIDLGLDPFELDDCGYTPAMYCWVGPETESSLLEMYSMSRYEDFFEPLKSLCASRQTQHDCFCHYITRTIKTYQTCRSLMCPSHETASIRSKLGCARDLLFFPNDIDGAVVKELLQPNWSQNLSGLCDESMCFESLIHTTALAIAQLQISETPKSDNPDSIFHVVDEVLKNTSDVHHIEEVPPYFRGEEHEPLTPLLTVLRYCCMVSWSRRNNTISNRISTALHMWLTLVRSAGHCLLEYGSRERALFHTEDLRLRKEIFYPRYFYEGYEGYEEKSGVIKLRLWGFCYGATPEDWKVFWSDEGHNDAADFWKLVEEPMELMPGSWVDDEDTDADLYFF
ncbi:hypothetical protein F5Y16DRAFT_357765 [Xylariaceae sp. FL0255]|nr:hypothetical protein F5Y16DRAFT_357765 [Xylariaceae sp. FL0255]